MKILILIFSLILSLGQILCAEDYIASPLMFFKHYGRADGVNNGLLHDIDQSPSGILWLGTGNGLLRFDGYQFSRYPIFESNSIDALYCDKEDAETLWFVSGADLYRLNTTSDEAQIIRVLSDSTVKSKFRIKQIFKDNLGNIWLLNSTGVYRYNPQNGGLKFFDRKLYSGKDLTSRVEFIYEDFSHKIWVGGFDCLAVYNQTKDRFENRLPAFGLAQGLRFKDIFQDKKGNLWLAEYNKGLIRLNSKTGGHKIFPLVRADGKPMPKGWRLNAVHQFENGEVWCSGNGHGLFVFNVNSRGGYLYKKTYGDFRSLGNDLINKIFVDRMNTVWLIHNSSISVIAYKSTRFVDFFIEYEAGTARNTSVNTIFEDRNGDYWISVLGLGFFYYDRNFSLIERVGLNITSPPIQPMIRFVANADAYHLWLGSAFGGLYRMDKRNTLCERINLFTDKKRESIRGGLQDKDGSLWLYMRRNHIIHYLPQSNTVRTYQLDPKKNHQYILSIYKDRLGVIWCGTNKGELYKHDQKLDRFILQSELPEETGYVPRIESINSTGNDTLWLATNRGLYYVDALKKKAYRYKTESFDLRVLSRLTIDDYGYLWVSNPDGLTRLKPFGAYKYSFNRNNELQQDGYDVSGIYKSSKGHLIFGNKNGLTFVYPGLPATQRQPVVSISEIKISRNRADRKLSLKVKENLIHHRNLKLPYDSYGIIINLFSDNLIDASHNHYRYQLRGFDRQWNDLERQHRISFFNLPPNSYSLDVAMTNSQGQTSSSQNVLSFEIQPPFWMTWWFWFWGVLVVILLIFILFQMRVYAIRLRNRELEAINIKLNDQISVRRQVEKMLRKSEIEYRTLVEGIQDGIYTLDKAGVFHFINKISAKRIGGDPADYVGRSIYSFYPEDVAEKHMYLIRKAIRSGASREVEVELQGRPGETNKQYRLAIHPLADDLGTIKLALVVARDITDRLHLENQLRQAQKMEAVGNLAGGIAHDFNNLLSVIRGYSFLLLNESDPASPFYESISEIDRAGERAQDLTRQLLAFGRKQMLKPMVMSLNRRVENMYKMLKRLLPDDIVLQVDLDSQAENVFADPSQMEQVLMNLVVNARDAMPLGGKIIIKTENRNLPQKLAELTATEVINSYVGMSVTDEGTGIKKELLDKIFEPFFSTKAKDKGTGLGLSTVFGIVKQSGGYIWVDSTPGKGSTFTVYLPAVKKEILREETDEIERTELRGSETILLVEDETGVLKMLSNLLRLYGYRVITAENGEAGLRLYQSEQAQIDLVISDVVMPVMNGVQMGEEIFKLDHKQKIIYMSGYTDEKIVSPGLNDNGVIFLQKPFTPAELLGKVRSCVSANSPASN